MLKDHLGAASISLVGGKGAAVETPWLVICWSLSVMGGEERALGKLLVDLPCALYMIEEAGCSARHQLFQSKA